jgi:hypothetical protein
MSMSNYAEEKILNAMCRATSYTSPGSVYICLYLTDPTDSDSGTEVSGGGYARQLIAFNAPVQTNGKATIVNSAEIRFPVATGSWGIVAHVGVRDASVAGNLLFFGPLNTSKSISIDDQLVFSAGDIKITLD